MDVNYLKFRRAVESSGEAIIITDLQGIITYINPEFTKIYGHTSDEVIGKVTPRILKSGTMGKETYEHMWNEILNKRVVKGEYINRTKDGRHIIIEGSANPILDDRNNIVGFLAIQRDISARRQTEVSLRESEEKFRLLIENLPISIVIYSQNKILYVNEECMKLFRVKDHEEIIGKSPLDFVHPDSYELVKERMKESKSSKLGVSVQKYIRTDGSLVIVEATASPTIFEKKAATQVMLQDITVRKLAEQALTEANQFNNQIIQSAREGIIVYDKELRFKVWNDFMENLTGLKAADVIGHDMSELLPVLNDKDVNELVRKSINGESSADVEFEFSIESTGKSGWVSDSTAPLRDASGEIIGVIRTVHDITKRKQTEIEYLHAKNKAEENDRLKTSFLCNMSHEIRTPMNGIYGFSQLLLRSDISEDKRKLYSESIRDCCEQLLETVNNILDISKIETGQLEVDNEIVDINSLLRDMFLLHNIKASSKNLSLVITLALQDGNCLIQTDKCKLQQIFNNLIDNAMKFTESGYVKFGYKIIKGQINFFVEDSGIGISEQNQNIIFDRFRQVESGLSRTYGGVGLGLSICKDLVRLLGGEIWVHSRPNKGSTFSFSMPYRPAYHIESKELSEDIHLRNSKLNILIVEDSYLNFIFIREVITTANYSFQYATNGREAIEILKSDNSIDLILMDIRMPVMDGYKALKIIKKIRPDIPVIAQTAYAVKGEKEKALKAGFTGFLSKPIMRNELIRTIQIAIR